MQKIIQVFLISDLPARPSTRIGVVGCKNLKLFFGFFLRCADEPPAGIVRVGSSSHPTKNKRPQPVGKYFPLFASLRKSWSRRVGCRVDSRACVKHPSPHLRALSKRADFRGLLSPRKTGAGPRAESGLACFAGSRTSKSPCLGRSFFCFCVAINRSKKFGLDSAASVL